MLIEDGYMKRLREQIESVETVLLRGDALDYPTYRELIGQRTALRKLEDDYKDLHKSLSRGEDNGFDDDETDGVDPPAKPSGPAKLGKFGYAG